MQSGLVFHTGVVHHLPQLLSHAVEMSGIPQVFLYGWCCHKQSIDRGSGS